MSVVRPFRSLSLLARTSLVLEVLLGLGAVAGGIALMLGPRGQIIPLDTALLAGSPFSDYFVPGLILFSHRGPGNAVGGTAGLARQRMGSRPTVAVGGALLIWLLVEFAVIGYTSDPPVQPVYLALGLLITIIGAAWMLRTGSPFRMPDRASRAH